MYIRLSGDSSTINIINTVNTFPIVGSSPVGATYRLLQHDGVENFPDTIPMHSSITRAARNIICQN